MRTLHRINGEYTPKCQCNIAAETAAAIIGAAGAVGAAGTQAYASGKMNKRAEKFNREEAEKQRTWNENMADKQNAWNYDLWMQSLEYDTPANQLQRLKEAGLNPLYYGLDGNAAPAAPDAAQPLGYERASAPNYENPAAAAIDAATKIAQIGNIQADTAKKNNENLTETQRREKLMADIEEVRQNVKLKMAQEGLTDTERKKLEKDLEWLDRINEATVAEKESNARLNDSQKKRIDELLEGEKIIQVKTIEDFDHKWEKIRAEISQIAAGNAILAKDLENYALNHANNGFMGTGLSIPNLVRGAKSLGSNIKKHPKTKQGQSILAEDNR